MLDAKGVLRKRAEKAGHGLAPGKKFPLARPRQVSVNHSCLASEPTAPHPLASGSARNLVLRLSDRLRALSTLAGAVNGNEPMATNEAQTEAEVAEGEDGKQSVNASFRSSS